MNNFVLLSFPKSIYKPELIKRAVADYREICRISTTETETETICRFFDSVADLQLTAQEFSNYLIELSNARGTL